MEALLAESPKDKALHAALAELMISQGRLGDAELHIEAALPSASADFNFLAGAFYFERRAPGA